MAANVFRWSDSGAEASGRKNSSEEKLKEENERLKSVITDRATENLTLVLGFKRAC
ncbi:MAG: hypothetical protein H7843_14375 [Nitrospirota bacterium]